MLFSIIIIYLILLYIIKLRIKDSVSRNLILIYTSYWIFSLVICNLNVYDYYLVDDMTYYLLLAHLVAFVLGFSMIQPKERFDLWTINTDLDIRKFLKNKFFICVFISAFLFTITLFIRQRALLAVYNLMDIRGDFMELILEDSGLAYLFHTIISTSVFHLSLVLLLFMLLFDRNWMYIIILASYIFMFASLGGGRNQFMTLGYYFLTMYILGNRIMTARNGFKTNFVLPRYIKIAMPIVIAFLIVAMSLMSAMRRGHMELSKEAFNEGFSELTETFGEYSAGPIVAFDIAMHDDYLSKLRHYGRATLNGTDYFLYILFHKYGFYKTSSYHTTITPLQHDGISIGPDRRWNYAYTSCMFYHFDFGKLGVVLIPFFLGLIARKLIGLIYNKLNFYSISIVLFISFCLYMSVFSGYIHKMMSIFYLAGLYFLSKKQIIKQ